MRITFIIILILTAMIVNAQDNNYGARPEPLKEKGKVFDDYEFSKLDCGLKTYLFEDRSRQYVKLRLMIIGGRFAGDFKPALSEMAAYSLINSHPSAGEKDFRKMLDRMGAVINAETHNDYICITIEANSKYTNEAAGLMADIVKNHDINDRSIEKALKMFPESIDKPGIEALARKVIYGNDHPLAHLITKADAGLISVDDINKYLENTLTNGNANLSVTGDFDDNEIIDILNKKFSGWDKGSYTRFKAYKEKSRPMGVYFMEDNNTKGYEIALASVSVSPSDIDNDKLKIASGVIEKRMRDDNLFGRPGISTYGYNRELSSFSKNIFVTGFRAGAQDKPEELVDRLLAVRESLIKKEQDEEILSKAAESIYYDKKMEVTDYDGLAKKVQFFNKEGVVPVAYSFYREKLSNITPYLLLQAADKNLAGQKPYIVARGPSGLAKSLEKYGQVFIYDKNLKPRKGPNADLEEVSMSPEELIEEYTDAIGGFEKISSINTIIDSCSIDMTFGAQEFNGTYNVIQQSPDKLYTELETPVFNQKVWVNGYNAWIQTGNKVEMLDKESAERYVFEARMFKFTKLISLGYKCKVLGEKENEILMEVIVPRGQDFIIYYDSESYLIKRTEWKTDLPGQGNVIEKYTDYRDYNGIKMPGRTTTISTAYSTVTTHNYIINKELGEEINFTPQNY